jgi:hypothetical protein
MSSGVPLHFLYTEMHLPAVALAKLLTLVSGWLMDETKPRFKPAWHFMISTFENFCQITELMMYLLPGVRCPGGLALRDPVGKKAIRG